MARGDIADFGGVGKWNRDRTKLAASKIFANIFCKGGGMPTLSENIQNRVNKLPKPSNYAQALQPVFEAISNAKFAIYDRFGAQALERGKIKIEVRAIRDAGKVSISVSDNGIGLDRARYEAFCTVDTDFKKEKGGKGVGRLFWLDAFRSIHVTSRYGDSESDIREFDFVLRKEDQVAEVEKPSVNFDGMGTSVEFRQVLDNEYSSYFPKKAETFFRYFSSHFISDFLMGVSPAIVVDVDGDVREYPSSIRELVVREDAPVAWTSDEFGDVSITGFCVTRKRVLGSMVAIRCTCLRMREQWKHGRSIRFSV